MNYAEAFTSSLEKINYMRPIRGDIATTMQAREQGTRNNILRYLGEYRLAVKFDEFSYREGVGPDGEKFLAVLEEEPISQSFRNAISRKEKEGGDSRREVAECIGFQKIEEAFLKGEDFLFLWISPPGKKEDGYGDYSFTFIGEVKNKKIRVVPYRNKLSLAQHREIAGIFSQDAESLKTDVDFLANPVFIQKEGELNNAEDLLVRIGEKERMDLSWRQRLEVKVRGLVDIFIEGVRRNAPDSELDKIRRAIENYTIDNKTEIIKGEFTSYDFDARHLVDTYGSYAPPRVAGSCGSSSSSTLMDFQSKLNPGNDKYGERSFECPSCGKTNIRPKDELVEKCQHCGSKDVAC
ncbi:MAG: hypothetical protein AAB662_01550 [Patescibacteria group bacterium]